MDYEALAYWARAALEGYPDLPTEVVREIRTSLPWVFGRHQSRDGEMLPDVPPNVGRG